MNTPSRPTPAHAHLGQTLTWLQSQQQNAERDAAKLRGVLEWLDSIAQDDGNSDSERANLAAMIVESRLTGIGDRLQSAREAIEALEFFTR